MIKVGEAKEEIKKSPRYSYYDVQFNEDGWADAQLYLPADYDLLTLIVRGRGKVSGWSVGHFWDGGNLRKQDKVLFWKRQAADRMHASDYMR